MHLSFMRYANDIDEIKNKRFSSEFEEAKIIVAGSCRWITDTSVRFMGFIFIQWFYLALKNKNTY